MRNLGIVVPAYNEEKRIGKMLDSYSSFFDQTSARDKFEYEILVVINNTTDNTLGVVEERIKKNTKINYLNLDGKGKGLAVIKGMKKMVEKDIDYIGFVDADMATPPEEFYKLLLKIGKNDGAIASRWVKGSNVEPVPKISRKIARIMFNAVIRSLLLFPYRDTQCGAKLFEKNILAKSLDDIKMSQWAFDVDLLYSVRKKGGKIIEIPTKWYDREYSKINFWKAGPFMVAGIVRIRLLNSPLAFMMRLYDKVIGRLWKISR